MNDFHYEDRELWCEETPVAKIAAEVGTPLYIYSHRTLKNHFRVFDDAFSEIPHLTCFAAKANSNIAILKIFVRAGGGVDIVSGGELYRALCAGVDPGKVVYSGVGKKIEEIEYALETGILMFNIESFQELEVINACAGRMKKKAGVALRVNPDVDPETHPYISTGLKENKFGINVEKSYQMYLQARRYRNLDLKGVSCHIGSQLTKISPFIDALKRIKNLLQSLQEVGIDIRYLDLGGGLGITYKDETPPHPSEYADAIIGSSRDISCTFIFEPGRVIVGNAGILVTTVLYTKENEDKRFIVVDAGMNDLVRPSLYKSYHHIQQVKKSRRKEIVADVVGPICESGDYLAKDRKLPGFVRGDQLAVMSAGAYGFTMSSNYNSRPRAAEVLVVGDNYHVIRKREDFRDLIRGEKIPDVLKNNAKSISRRAYV
ncbi:MAG TPA: diaminopimelate decarboxylase [Syntrophales bacterium]|nr:diaminopimelate decarboxylase [Syntrophales bacterium]HOU76621.1 diaminopimelate decarboxylase [Syntrophales bacterium]HPC31378.1 diaminopimelate decarboxylase [Syntrophales bacterium]HQG33284.1 diaminopimelate decarboxylase [Syntrophales bacterium]HQI35060.1 diaminopimelate decarboxylase [Syntrophales bacterium]